MKLTEGMRVAMKQVVEELTPIAEEMNSYSTEHGIKFKVTDAQVNINYGGRPFSALSHVEFREIGQLSSNARRGIIRSYDRLVVSAIETGEEAGKRAIREGMKTLLGIA